MTNYLTTYDGGMYTTTGVVGTYNELKKKGYKMPNQTAYEKELDLFIGVFDEDGKSAVHPIDIKPN